MPKKSEKPIVRILNPDRYIACSGSAPLNGADKSAIFTSPERHRNTGEILPILHRRNRAQEVSEKFLDKEIIFF
jgi:hypothetical protein